MQVRPARSADAEAINELLDALGYLREGQPTTAARIQIWADDPASAAYVADAQGDLLGVVAVQICPLPDGAGTYGRIVTLVVSDRARGQGIGSRLVATAESFATTHGCLRIEYWPLPSPGVRQAPRVAADHQARHPAELPPGRRGVPQVTVEPAGQVHESRRHASLHGDHP